MVQNKTYSKAKAMALSVVILFSVSLFAQSEKASEKSTIVMTKSELNSFLTTIAEARRTQLQERENKRLNQELTKLRLRYKQNSTLGNERTNAVSNQEILNELRYLNQRIDNLNVNPTYPTSTNRGNSTIILPGNAAQNAAYLPNDSRSTTVVSSNKENIKALQYKIDSLKNAEATALSPKNNQSLSDSIRVVNRRFEAVERQLDSLERRMKTTHNRETRFDKENRGFFKKQVYFENNSETLSSEYGKYIQDLTQILRKYPEAKVMLEGWASPLGKPDYNKQLSMRRSESVEKVFLNNSITKNRILTSFRGEDTLSSAQHARRVEMSIIVR